MVQGKMKDGQTKKALVSAKFYRKYAGTIVWSRKKCLIIQETEKAFGIREQNQEGEESYSQTGIWVPKSKVSEVIFLEVE